MTLLSPNWITVKVFGTFTNIDGTPAVGQIIFKSVYTVEVDSTIVLPKPITVTLDSSGYFEVYLPATDDPDISVRGWAYEVVEKFNGARAPYSIEVPYNSMGIDLATVIPSTPVVEYSTYLRFSDIGVSVASQEDVEEAQATADGAVEDAAAAQATANTAVLAANTAQATANTATIAAATADGKAVAAQTDLNNHKANTANPHSVTAAQLNLGNVDNTSDANKPISTAQAAALALKAALDSPALTGTPTAPTAALGTNTNQIATMAAIAAAIANLLDSAPGALDTLNELAAAIGDDPNFAATVTNALAQKQPLDATLTALAGLNTTTGVVEQTGTDTFTKRAIGVSTTTSLLQRSDGDGRYQQLSTALTAFLALSFAANKLPYATGATTFALADFTAFARTLLDDADGPTALATLGAIALTQKGAASGVVPLNADTKIDPIYRAKKIANVAISSGSVTFDLSTADDFYIDVNTNVTASSFTNTPPAGYVREGTIITKQDATGGRTFVFPSGTRWPNKLAAVLTSAANSIDQFGYRLDNRTGTLLITFYPVRDIG